MVNGIRASDSRGFNKGRDSKFHVGFRVRQEAPEEGRRTYRPKYFEYNNKNEDNSPKTLNDKNLQEILRQLNLPKKLLMIKKKSNLDSLWRKNLTQYRT